MVDHRERLKNLIVPERIKAELLRDYKTYLSFENMMKLNIWDKKVADFMMLEYKIKCGTIYTENFMLIIKLNKWIHYTFNTFSHE